MRSSDPSAAARRLPLALAAAALPLAGAFFPAAAQTPDPAKKPVALPAITVEDKAAKPDANPNANPNAPLAVERSANPKFVKPLLDTPKSVTAITKEQIQESGATSLREVMRQQPGVTLGTGEGGNAFGDRIFIRGFDARNDVFIDGLRDPGVISRETFAVEQLEVVKGPSSTIGGRGTTGGSVDIVTKTPTDKSFIKGEGSLGTDNYRRLTADVNQVISDRFAVRFNGLIHDTDVAGRKEVFDKRYGGAVAAQIKPADDWKITLDYYHLNTDAMPDWGIPYDTRAGAPFNVPRDTFYGIVGRDYWKTNADIGTVRVEGKLNSNLKLDVRTRYGVTGNDYVISAPEGVNLTALTVGSNAKTREQTNKYGGIQANLIYDLDSSFGQHTFVAGTEISREKVFNRAPGVNPRSITQPIYNPNPNYPWTGQITGGTSISDTTVDTRAFYLSDTLELSDQWQVSGGIRYDQYDIGAYSGPGDYSATANRATYEKGFVNWNVGLVYKPVPYASLYGAVSTSSNPPGEQIDGGTSAGYGGLAPGYAQYSPERNTNFEIGTKWQLFDRRLNVNAAIFYTLKDEMLVNSGTRYSNGGSARSAGFEIGVAGNITDEWSVTGGYTYLDAKVTDNPLNPSVKNKNLANIAKHSLLLQTKYQVTEAFSIGGSANYRSEVYGGTFEALSTKVPSYWRFDLMSEYKINQNASLRLNILNLTDETYYDTLYRSASPFTYVAPGRSAMMSLAVTF